MDCFLEISSLGVQFYDEAVMCQVQALRNIRTGIVDMNGQLSEALKDKAALENKVNNLNKELQRLKNSMKLKEQASTHDADETTRDSSSNYEGDEEVVEDMTATSEIEDRKETEVRSNGKPSIFGAQKRKRRRSQMDMTDNLERTKLSVMEQLPLTDAFIGSGEGAEDLLMNNRKMTSSGKHIEGSLFRLSGITQSPNNTSHLMTPPDKSELTLLSLKDEMTRMKATLNSLLMNQTRILTQNSHIENQLNMLLNRQWNCYHPDFKEAAPCVNGKPLPAYHPSDGVPAHIPQMHGFHSPPGQPVVQPVYAQSVLPMYSPTDPVIRKTPEHFPHAVAPLAGYRGPETSTPLATDASMVKSPNRSNEAVTPQQPSSAPKSPDPGSSDSSTISPKKEPMSQEVLLMIQARSQSVKNFAVNLMRHLYSKEEMAGKNVRGSSKQNGKSGLEPLRVQLIKHYVQATYPVEDEASQWQSCVDAMNEALRRKR